MGLAAVGVTALSLGAHVVAEARPRIAEPLHGEVGLGLVALGVIGVIGCLLAHGWWRRLALLGVGLLGTALAAEAWLPAAAPPRWLTAELVVGTTVLGLSFLGLGLARRVRLLSLSSRIRADLGRGEVECFEGSTPNELGGSDLTSLRARAHERLEVLPRSGLVIRTEGRRPRRWSTVHMVEVAPTQPHALRVALPRGVAPASSEPGLSLRRRSLTPVERAELARHITQLRRRWWPLAALTLVVVGLVAWDVRTAAPHEAFPLGGASLGWLALLVVVYIGYGRRVLAARKLEHDRSLRWVVTVHQDTADPQHDPPTLEVLPISQLAWTERTSPAGWRLSRL